MNKELIFTDGKTMQAGVMYCIGKNYSLHIKEMGGEAPKDPVVFLKPPAAYLPDGGTIELPDISDNVHHEVELVVIIGKDARNISKEKAKDYIAGYAVGIDVTLRDIQKNAKDKGLPWAVAKGFYTSAPISKIVPAGEIKGSDPVFDLNLELNGEIKQSGSTGDMERPVSALIAYLSNIFSLRKGDIIFTGTPHGVGQIKKGDKLTAKLSDIVDLKVNAE